MFQEKTVFILGAGASWHYGLPTGADLIREIEMFCTHPSSYIPIYRDELGNLEFETLLESIPNLGGLLDNKIYTSKLYHFYERLRSINPLVIDNFLDENSDLEEIGKIAIASVIMHHEAKFFAPEGGRRNSNLDKLNDKSIRNRNFFDNDDWCRFIINHLVKDAQPFSNNHEEKIRRFFQGKILDKYGCHEGPSKIYNDVHFVTFNYDTTLETRLYESLSKVYFLDGKDDELKKFLFNHVLHVYGSVRDDFSSEIIKPSPPPNTDKDSIIKQYKDYYKQLTLGANRISTTNSKKMQSQDVQENLSKIKYIIHEAEKIYILGYGFDSVNNNRIGLDEVLEKNNVPARKICYTNFENKNVINKSLLRYLKPGQLADWKNQMFFDNQPPVWKPSERIDDRSIIFEKSTRDVYDALASDFVF